MMLSPSLSLACLKPGSVRSRPICSIDSCSCLWSNEDQENLVFSTDTFSLVSLVGAGLELRPGVVRLFSVSNYTFRVCFVLCFYTGPQYMSRLAWNV